MQLSLIFQRNEKLPPYTRRIEVGFKVDDITIGDLIPLEDFLAQSEMKIEAVGYSGIQVYDQLLVDPTSLYNIEDPYASSTNYLIYSSADEAGHNWLYLKYKPPVIFMLLKSKFIPNSFQHSR